ncbi:MAG: Ser/Thr and Tyr protein phosphatase [Candidatus Accumulibacter sp.]|nr:Ser/Thr and Tyr protein phosphatase [Accumulibacter sp.]
MVFFIVYPTTNWLAGRRSHPYSLFVEQELGVPFVPQFIWFYLSMYVLFFFPPFFLSPENLRRLAKELMLATGVAGVMFLIFPGRLGFSRTLPTDPFYRVFFDGLFALDPPFNLVPSLHVVYSTAIVLAISAHAGAGVRFALHAWLVLTVASTVLVHQHHFLDVVTGLALALLMRFYWKKKHV